MDAEEQLASRERALQSLRRFLDELNAGDLYDKPQRIFSGGRGYWNLYLLAEPLETTYHHWGALSVTRAFVNTVLSWRDYHSKMTSNDHHVLIEAYPR